MMPRFERRVMALWKKSSARLRQSFLDENRQSAENDIAARFLMASFFSWLRDDDAPGIILLVLPACPNG